MEETMSDSTFLVSIISLAVAGANTIAMVLMFRWYLDFARLSVTFTGEVICNLNADGTGISTDQKNRIFERGYEANTGPGLYLPREIRVFYLSYSSKYSFLSLRSRVRSSYCFDIARRTGSSSIKMIYLCSVIFHQAGIILDFPAGTEISNRAPSP